MPQLEAMKVAVHGVSAEPGGDALFAKNMAVRGTRDLGFPIHSDPEFKLLPRPLDEIFSFTHKPDYVTSYAPHNFVQPAMVLLDRQGQVRTAWSWKLDKKMPTRVKLDDWERIKTRPRQSDIIPSIQEQRMVKTQKYAGGAWIP